MLFQTGYLKIEKTFLIKIDSLPLQNNQTNSYCIFSIVFKNQNFQIRLYGKHLQEFKNIFSRKKRVKPKYFCSIQWETFCDLLPSEKSVELFLLQGVSQRKTFFFDPPLFCQIFLLSSSKHNFAFDFPVNRVYMLRFIALEDCLFEYEEWIYPIVWAHTPCLCHANAYEELLSILSK
jgi:hypothetical protein